MIRWTLEDAEREYASLHKKLLAEGNIEFFNLVSANTTQIIEWLKTSVNSQMLNSNYFEELFESFVDNDISPLNDLTAMLLKSDVQFLKYLKHIPNNCFNTLPITHITLPENILSIGKAAFNYCDRLITMYIPKSVSIIEPTAFEDCTALKKITFGGTKDDWKVLNDKTMPFAKLDTITVICSDGNLTI